MYPDCILTVFWGYIQDTSGYIVSSHVSCSSWAVFCSLQDTVRIQARYIIDCGCRILTGYTQDTLSSAVSWSSQETFRIHSRCCLLSTPSPAVGPAWVAFRIHSGYSQDTSRFFSNNNCVNSLRRQSGYTQDTCLQLQHPL